MFRGSQELAAVLAAVAVGAGFEVSRICSRLVSVSSSFDGVSDGSDFSLAGVATGVGSFSDGAGSSIVGVGSTGACSGTGVSATGSGALTSSSTLRKMVLAIVYQYNRYTESRTLELVLVLEQSLVPEQVLALRTCSPNSSLHLLE